MFSREGIAVPSGSRTSRHSIFAILIITIIIIILADHTLDRSFVYNRTIPSTPQKSQHKKAGLSARFGTLSLFRLVSSVCANNELGETREQGCGGMGSVRTLWRSEVLIGVTFAVSFGLNRSSHKRQSATAIVSAFDILHVNDRLYTESYGSMQ